MRGGDRKLGGVGEWNREGGGEGKKGDLGSDLKVLKRFLKALEHEFWRGVIEECEEASEE